MAVCKILRSAIISIRNKSDILKGGGYMIFCKIDKKLIDIIKKYSKGRTIVDCGCGAGLLGSMLPEVISIDIIPRENTLIKDILYMDVCKFPFTEQHFPIFIRPCHGHFISNFLFEHGNNVADCLYILHPKNVENDIDRGYNIKQIENWEGQDGERVFLVTLNKELVKGTTGKYKFVRLRWGYIPEEKSDGSTFWRKEQNGMWINSAGGRCNIHTTNDSDSWIVVETVYADDFDELDWSKTYLNDPEKESGWLSPEGIFYGCPYESHDDCAYYILKKSVAELENEGYIRIYHKDQWSCSKDITEVQAKFLLDNNYIDEWGRLKEFEENLSLGKSWSKARKYMNQDGD
jgi:hypothetical protein